MHQSHGQEHSQGSDSAFEGKEKPFGLTEMTSKEEEYSSKNVSTDSRKTS